MLDVQMNSTGSHGKTLPYRVLAVGLGGGGSNAVGRFSFEWVDGPHSVAINTDAQALASCGVARHFLIGRNLTQGFGTGGDVAAGKLAAEDDGDMLKELVSGVDLLFIVATLGGGTATGAAPVLARLARESGALVICFATLPFDFEGEQRRRQAEEGLRLLKHTADTVIVLPNQRLFELVEDQTSLVDAFKKADEMVGICIRAIWKLLVQAGLINLNFADLRNMVEHSGGTCAFGYGEGRGSRKMEQAVSFLLEHPLLDHGNVLMQTGAVMVNILGGSDLTLVEVQTIMKRISSALRSDARVYMGTAVDETYANRVVLTMLAAENWGGEGGLSKAEVAKPDPIAAAAENETSTGITTKTGIREVQPTLNFDSTDKGRFKGVDPTLYEGEDLDIPTFIRRGIKLSFDR